MEKNRLEIIVGVIRDIFTIVAIIAAGYWFCKQGLWSPSANVSHYITHRKLNDDNTYIHVKVMVTNIGKAPIELTDDNNSIWLQQILPIDNSNVEISVKGNKYNMYTINWPKIKETEVYHPKPKHTIYPGENDKLFYDFIIPSKVKTIRVYSYYKNNCDPNFGWSEATIYDLAESAGVEK